MSEPVQRRPLPALIFLLALTLLTAIVWWRVATRHDSSAQTATPSCNTSATPSVVPPPAGIALTVLNATNGFPHAHNGIAAKAATAFENAGFTIAKKDNDTGRGVPGVAVIRFGPTQRAQAVLISYYLPGAQLVQQDVDQTSIVISLGLKFTSVATGAQVNAALAKSGIAVSTVRPSPTPGC